MAIDAGKVVAMLELDTSQFSGSLSSSQKLLQAWGDKNLSLSDKLKSTGQAVTGLGKTLSTAVTLPIVGMGTAAVKTFTGFDDAMRQVRATMNATEEDTAKLTAAAKEMGATTRYTASDSANALNYLALAGYNADQAIEALPTVLRLAQAGGLDLAYASDLITDSMSALGMSMDELTGFADQMAKTSQKSNTNVSQLGEAILTVGGTAKGLKGGTVELNAELGILADNGIKGAEGGTHLRNMILALQSPTKDGAEALKKYTTGVYDATGQMRSLDEIFQELAKSMSTMTNAERDNVIGNIFNKTDLAAANALLAGCGDRFKELSEMIANSTGTAQEMADIMEGGIGGSFRNLSSAAEGLAIAFGESLAPTVKSVADVVTGITRSFTELPEGVRNTITEILAFAAAAGPVLLVGGKLISMFGTMGGKITLAIGAVGALVSIFENLKGKEVKLGISADELENYKLPETIDLGEQTAEFVARVQNKGKSVYEQIVEIMNDGLPETEEEYQTMAAGINSIIDESMQAIEENYNTRAAALKDLLDKGVIDEAEYSERIDKLKAKTDEEKAALESDAEAIKSYVRELIAANAPMTEEQIAYLQTLIDKLVETSTAAGIAEDAVLNGYKMAYERVKGGYALEGDVEKASQYVEVVYGGKKSATEEARQASQADFAALIDSAQSKEEIDAIVAESTADMEKWNAVLDTLNTERQAMYAEMLNGAIAEEEGLGELLAEFTKAYGEWQKVYAENMAAPKNFWERNFPGFGGSELTEYANKITEIETQIGNLDVSKIREIMGRLYANDETLDAENIDTTREMIQSIIELSGQIQPVETTEIVDADGMMEELGTLHTDATAEVDAMGTDVAAAADVRGAMQKAGENSAAGYAQGLENGIGAVQTAAAKLASAGTVGTLQKELDQHSPSRVMRRLGQFTAEGFALGISDNETLVRHAVEHMAGQATNIETGGGVGARGGGGQKAVTLNLNGAVIRSDEDARTLARTLGTYVTAMNYGV